MMRVNMKVISILLIVPCRFLNYLGTNNQLIGQQCCRSTRYNQLKGSGYTCTEL